ncbi:hypothetical protein P5784_29705, partial [Bacillus cereus]|uniref:hypothetical protein n=1 Tax=Bacillus cereus TaxID=1396 RepID=UPI0024068647
QTLTVRVFDVATKSNTINVPSSLETATTNSTPNIQVKAPQMQVGDSDLRPNGGTNELDKSASSSLIPAAIMRR